MFSVPTSYPLLGTQVEKKRLDANPGSSLPVPSRNGVPGRGEGFERKCQAICSRSGTKCHYRGGDVGEGTEGHRDPSSVLADGVDLI